MVWRPEKLIFERSWSAYRMLGMNALRAVYISVFLEEKGERLVIHCGCYLGTES